MKLGEITHSTNYDSGGDNSSGRENEQTCSKQEEWFLRLITPLRLKKDGQILRHFNSDVFFRSLRRRMLLLYYLYSNEDGPAEQVWEYDQPQDWEQLIKRIDVASYMLHWQDLGRYSTRQKRKTPLGGITGEITFSGDWELAAPYFKAAEWLQVGRSTSFGCGVVKVIRDEI